MIFLLLLLANLHAAEYSVVRATGVVISFDEKKICMKNLNSRFCIKRLPRFEFLTKGRGVQEIIYTNSDLIKD